MLSCAAGLFFLLACSVHGCLLCDSLFPRDLVLSLGGLTVSILRVLGYVSQPCHRDVSASCVSGTLVITFVTHTWRRPDDAAPGQSWAIGTGSTITVPTLGHVTGIREKHENERDGTFPLHILIICRDILMSLDEAQPSVGPTIVSGTRSGSVGRVTRTHAPVV